MKRLLALALATLMVLSLVACGGGGTTSGGATSGGTTSGGTTEPTKEYKEEVVVGISVAMTQWDPYRDTTNLFIWMYNMVYESLLWLDMDTAEIQPRLATSWEYSENNTVLTMKLREDVYFHNGELFDSDDVVFSFDRMHQAVAKGISSSVVNMAKDVEVEAVDQFTVKFKFTTPNPDYVFTLAQPYMCMLNRDAFKNSADPIEWPEVGVAGFVPGVNDGYTVGTGQYMWSEHVDNDHDTLVKREDGKYWGEDNPTKKFTFRLIAETAARLLALETGEIDYCYSVSSNDIDVVKDNKDLTLLSGDRTGVHYLAWNTSKDGVWQDANFRYAFTKAINRDNIVLAMYAGHAVPADSMYNRLQFGYVSCADTHGYDPEGAKALLAKSSYKGETITIMTSSSYKNAVLAMVEDLKAVGITAVLQEENNSNVSPLLKADGQDCHVYNINLNPNGDDMRRFLNTGFGKHGIDASPNKDKIYGLLDAAMATDDRAAAYAEVQKALCEDCFYVPLVTPKAQDGHVATMEGAYWRASTVQDLRNVCVVVK